MKCETSLEPKSSFEWYLFETQVLSRGGIGQVFIDRENPFKDIDVKNVQEKKNQLIKLFESKGYRVQVFSNPRGIKFKKFNNQKVVIIDLSRLKKADIQPICSMFNLNRERLYRIGKSGQIIVFYDPYLFLNNYAKDLQTWLNYYELGALLT